MSRANVRAVRAQLLAILREALALARQKSLWGLGFVLLTLGLVWAVYPLDHPWEHWIREHQKPTWLVVARAASLYGEIHFVPLLTLVALAAVGVWRNNAKLRWAALAGILAGVMGGISVNIIKVFVGRPRPSTSLPDALHPFHFGWSYASFPSGHATHCAAIAVAVILLAPRSGFLAVLGSLVVMWSRWYLDRHYPTDILAGACFGAAIGLLCGLAAKRVLRAQAESVETSRPLP